jgi:hypothetical protein
LKEYLNCCSYDVSRVTPPVEKRGKLPAAQSAGGLCGNQFLGVKAWSMKLARHTFKRIAELSFNLNFQTYRQLAVSLR